MFLNKPKHMRYRGRIVNSEQTRDELSGVLVDHSTDIFEVKDGKAGKWHPKRPAAGKVKQGIT